MSEPAPSQHSQQEEEAYEAVGPLLVTKLQVRFPGSCCRGANHVGFRNMALHLRILRSSQMLDYIPSKLSRIHLRNSSFPSKASRTQRRTRSLQKVAKADIAHQLTLISHNSAENYTTRVPERNRSPCSTCRVSLHNDGFQTARHIAWR